MSLMLGNINNYTGFILNAMKAMYAYRLRMIIWIFYDFIILFVQYYLWNAIFSSSGGSLMDISLSQYLSYVAFGLVFSRLVSSDIDGEIAQEIKNGTIAMHLLKPYSYFGAMTAQRVGYTVGQAIALIPVTLTILFLVDIPPLSPFLLGATLVSMLLTYALVTVLQFILGILAFWLTNYWGLFLFKQNIIALFSGELIALNLLFRLGRSGIPNFPVPWIPEGVMQNIFLGLGWISYLLPFQAMAYTPSGIFTGMIQGPWPVLGHVALQIFWLMALSGLASHTWKRAQRHITILGG